MKIKLRWIIWLVVISTVIIFEAVAATVIHDDDTKFTGTKDRVIQ
jgi:hypothetical protein